MRGRRSFVPQVARLSRPHAAGGIAPLLIWVVALLCGCAAVPDGPPTEAERAALQSGGLAMVVMKVELDLDVEVRSPWAWSASSAAGRRMVPMDDRRTDPSFLHWVLGSFETAGRPTHAMPRALSEQSRAAGWTYFLLAPGIYYPGISKWPYSAADRMQQVVWRVDVPVGSRILYAGSVIVRGKGVGLNPTNVRWIDTDQAAVVDERDVAESQLASHGLDPRDMSVSLLRRWREGEPLVFRAPVDPKPESAPSR